MGLIDTIHEYDLCKGRLTDYIDTRTFVEARENAEGFLAEHSEDDGSTSDKLTPEEVEELEGVIEQINDLSNEISEFTDGNTLVPESEWESYARQLADDIGAIPDDASWPCTCIDWERAARELAMDYTLIDIDGTDYYARS